MGNLCCRTIPNINLSHVNNGMISSCCKSDSKSTEMPKFYKWIFTIKHNERIFCNTSAAWLENFAQCNEDALHNIQMCCRLSTRPCEKIGFFKRFDFQKERFLMPEKSFFLLQAYLKIRTVKDSIKNNNIT